VSDLPEAPTPTSPAGAARPPAVRVLLVDDDPAVLRVTTGILRALGYEVWAFADGRHALRHLQEQAVDVVVSDILMPDLDGFELTQQLRRSPGQVPVVLVSGGGGRVGLGDVSGIGALLADQFLKKPYSAAELRSAIDAALAAGRARGG
jgi:CheY-like chemotaxis protein